MQMRVFAAEQLAGHLLGAVFDVSAADGSRKLPVGVHDHAGSRLPRRRSGAIHDGHQFDVMLLLQLLRRALENVVHRPP